MSRRKKATPIVVEVPESDPMWRLERATRVLMKHDPARYLRLLAAFEATAAAYEKPDESSAEWQARMDQIHGKRPEAN